MTRPGVWLALFVFATIKHIFLLKVKLKTQNNITTMSYNNNMSHKRLPITNNVLFRLCWGLFSLVLLFSFVFAVHTDRIEVGSLLAGLQKDVSSSSNHSCHWQQSTSCSYHFMMLSMSFISVHHQVHDMLWCWTCHELDEARVARFNKF